jgi:hypothetical protein
MLEQPPAHLTVPGANVTAIAAGPQWSAAVHSKGVSVWGSDKQYPSQRFVPLPSIPSYGSIVDVAIAPPLALLLFRNGTLLAVKSVNEVSTEIEDMPTELHGGEVTAIASHWDTLLVALRGSSDKAVRIVSWGLPGLYEGQRPFSDLTDRRAASIPCPHLQSSHVVWLSCAGWTVSTLYGSRCSKVFLLLSDGSSAVCGMDRQGGEDMGGEGGDGGWFDLQGDEPMAAVMADSRRRFLRVAASSSRVLALVGDVLLPGSPPSEWSVYTCCEPRVS